VVYESIILTDTVIESGAIVEQTIIDKHVCIGENAHVGAVRPDTEPLIAMIGKNSVITPNLTIEPGAVIGTDVCGEDFSTDIIRSDEYIQTKRLAYEV
jgi:ADP-glucose pyrophosphorylase